MQEPTEEELVDMAAQLRKPEGEAGLKIGDFMNEGNLVMNLHAIAALNPKENESVLEIGMGNGAFVRNVLGIDDTIRYVGLDYSELMVRESINNNQTYVDQGRALFQCGNISAIPFEDDSFDCVLTINTFYFWDDSHQHIIQELKRVLRPGGRLLIAVRPYHVMKQLPVTQFNFGLIEDHELIALFKDNGFNRLRRTDLVEPEFEAWGQTYRLESMFLEFSTEG